MPWTITDKRFRVTTDQDEEQEWWISEQLDLLDAIDPECSK